MIQRVLPQISEKLFLTDGGIETTLVFQKGQTLPHFAAFHLLNSGDGRKTLKDCYLAYAELGRRFGVGMVMESPTWRANPDWGSRLGYSSSELAKANRESILLMEEIRAEYETDQNPIVLSGCIGPRGDGYAANTMMNVEQARAYHIQQVEMLGDSGADMICGMTINYAEEAIGISLAAREIGIPVAISFTVETDGNLPSGESLQSAIERVDKAMGLAGVACVAGADDGPIYYMINCAHPTHFASQLIPGAPWVRRIRGIRANASQRSHKELDESTELDSGDPCQFGVEYAALKARHPHLNILGGCCGTDPRHVEQIAVSCAPLFA